MLTLEEVLSNNSDTLLSDEEIHTLIESRYVINANTPNRIKKNMKCLYYSYKINRRSIDFDDPIIIDTFENTDDYLNKFNFFKQTKNFTGSLPPRRIDKIPGFNHNTPLAIDKFINDPLGDIDYVIACNSYPETLDNKVEISADSPVVRRLGFVNNMSSIDFRYGSTSSSNKEKIVRIFKKHNVNVNMIPYRILIDETFIETYFENESPEVRNLMKKILNDKSISEKIEKEAMETFFANYDSLDDYLYDELDKFPQSHIDQMKHIIAAKLYGSKVLSDYGIDDVRINPNNYCNSLYVQDGVVVEQLGGYNDERKSMSFHPTSNLSSSIGTTSHEARHAIQHKAMINGDIEKIPNLPTMAKDDYLKSKIGNSYYDENYYSIASEYDADNVSNSEIDRITKMKKIHFSPYRDTPYRRVNGNTAHIDDIFELKLNLDIKHSVENGTFDSLLDEIKETTPILLYQYNITENGVTRKTQKELIESLDKVDNIDEFNIIKGIIKANIDEKQTKNYLQNIEDTKGIINNPNIPLDIRSILKEQLETTKHYTVENGIKKN